MEEVSSPNREPEIIIIPPEVDMQTDEKDFDDNDMGSSNFSSDIPGEVEVQFSSDDEVPLSEVAARSQAVEDNESDSPDDNVPLSVPCSKRVKTSKSKKEEKPMWTKNYIDISMNGKTMGYKERLQKRRCEVQTFERLFDKVIKLIVEQSNLYASQKNNHGFVVTETKIKIFLGILLLFGYHKLPRAPMYWSVDNDVSVPLVASKNGIILIALCPNSTHITQPMDVAVFRTLKSAWRNAVQQWKIDNNGCQVKKEDFAPILEKAILTSVTPEVLANGFKSTGLHPLDPSAIKYEKYFKADHSRSLANSTSLLEKSTSNDKLSYLEKFIEKETLIEFRNTIGDQWNDDIKNTSLYFVWRTMKNDNEKDATNITIPYETEQGTESPDLEILGAPETIEIERPAERNEQQIIPSANINQEPQPYSSVDNHEEVTPLKNVPT
ncbi:hypothetical protein JTB14_024108 [Gonioctena quinquepunctata]|nr:hypothetical protein JTB14_024108 [Gonioctena quinquepunctata]